ncbi:uncharacterized protein THITE_2108103 [Thermothielavioides terrestris NRRL 8126]|uniref:Uncharacterized protein n=1 Tax=Thermothielavioides terrestris (strain ATCC 38088 / NRRL 8126) TaxID=578455 RepID=G2QXS6_THETT|nr:uncharacterized protein THITE_2108103 [Thermothielavioides terrestris NRRL 8126]AEO63194.1 hypothetical protein THITE_2108103 [Thermothielavioides terrestris NRRL 8126]
MDGSENANFRSGLRPPQVHASAITAPTTCLQEISDSQHNARAQPTGIPQKRGHLGIPQPDPKRKTLVERAGEPLKSQIPTPGVGLPRPATSIKGSSIAALSSNNPSATASRHGPAGSFSKSMGPGSRAPPATRAPTSMGFAQSTSGRPRGLTRTRPATAMGSREVEEEPRQSGQPKV